MARRRPPALLLAAPLILLGCGRDDPAANNAAEAENRALADLLDVGDTSFAAADDKGGPKGKAAAPPKAAPPPKARPPASEPPRRGDQQARRAGERG